MNRPNILYIMADQFRGDALSCVGKVGHTPNLDALASEGVCFTNCNTVAPLCVPARISIMTGKYPHDTTAWDNAIYILDPKADLWTKEIKKQGYESSLIGKTHLHSDYGDMTVYEPVINDYGFDFVNEISGPHSTCDTRTHMSDWWKEEGVLDSYVEDMLQRTYPFAKSSPLDEEHYYDTYVGEQGAKWLRNHKEVNKSGEGKPWFLHVSFGGPHEPWDAPEPYASMYPLEDMKKPLPPFADEYDRPKGLYDEIGAKPKNRVDEKTALELRQNYLGSCTLIDKKLGEIFDVIKERGEWDNTVVLFVSDHGDLNGDHGFAKKRNYFEGALNVPLIIKAPGTKDLKEHFCSSLVSNIDVGPTLAELAGAKVPGESFARSLVPLLNDKAIKDGLEIRGYSISELSGEYMYKDHEWKIVLNKDKEVYYMFHIGEDPDELVNLAGHPDYIQTREELRKRLLDLISENTCKNPGKYDMPPVAGHGDFNAFVKSAEHGDAQKKGI